MIETADGKLESFRISLATNMTSRALIIAIENYPQSRSTSQKLPGTTANAEQFATWLETNLQISREHIAFCCSGDCQFRTHGDTRKEIKTAILELTQKGIDDTEQLFVYLTGHGVMKPGLGIEPHTDLLLCSDFVSSDVSGDACLSVAEISTILSRSLGAGTHLYFVDACRTIDPNLEPASLGVKAQSATSGVANWFQLLSASAGTAAKNDSQFVQNIIGCLEGNCDLKPDPAAPGHWWVTFANVARALEQKFFDLQRGVEVRTLAEKSDHPIRSLRKAATATPIVGSDGRKSPPVELLKAYEDVVFLGETNGQLPKFIEQAFKDRNQRRWKSLTIFSIEDLSHAGRPGVPLSDLETERQLAEDYLRSNASKLAERLVLHRYSYVGTYGSLWTAADGRRRIHVSPRMLGMDIRSCPSTDLVDFPESRHPTVDLYFQLAASTSNGPECRRVFAHPEMSGGSQ